MQYKYNKDTNSLELVNKNIVIVNNAITSGNGEGASTITIKTESPNFLGKEITLTNGETVLKNRFDNVGNCTISDVPDGVYSISLIADEQTFTTKIEVKSNYLMDFNASKTYTVMLNQSNGDAAVWGTWADDAKDLTNATIQEFDDFMGFYACCIDRDGNEVCKVDPNDFSKTITGESLPDDVHVMIKFPCRGYRIKRKWIDGVDYLIVSVTDNLNAESDGFQYITYESKKVSELYIGAYRAFSSNEKLYSQRGRIFSNGTMTTLRTYAQNNGQGFGLMTFPMLTYLQCCLLIRYKGKRAQLSLGKGHYYGSSLTSGYSDTWGYFGGSHNISDSDTGIKCFGLESLWESPTTKLDGIYLASDGYLYISDGTGGYNDFNGYDNIGRCPNGTFWASIPLWLCGRPSNPEVGDKRLGFISVNSGNEGINGSDSRYLCAKQNFSLPSDVAEHRWLSFGNVSVGGLFEINAESEYANHPARLVFCRID